MLQVTRKGSTLTVETLAGQMTWDAQGGGQISSFVIKEELGEHSLLPERALMPEMQITVNGKRHRLADTAATMETVLTEADFIKFTAKSQIAGGALNVTQEYEVHEEGAIFCNLIVEVQSGAKVELNNCSLDLGLDTSAAAKAAWGYFSRQMRYKRDYATIHPYLDAKVRRELSEIADERELFPFVSLDLGWGNTRFFANHIEFLMEEWTALDDGAWTNTRSRAGQENGLFRLSWRLYEGPAVTLSGPRRYRNRWGILFGRARNRAGAQADPAVRNNALGARICHCKYPYARAGDRWPWVSMPIKQVEQQAPQLFEGNPGIERADEAADAGADLLILHQFWMSNPGTNNEPPSDYKAFDPAWLKAFVNRCHDRRIRVLLYIRGTEQWLHYSSFFEDYLQKDFDGMYADWNTVFFMGYGKSSPLHLSMHNYFHFSKTLRQRVGPGGILVGHTANTNLITLASYDAALNGETSVRHDELLVNPEMTSYFACLHSIGGHLISGNLPDRKAFSSPKVTVLCAALGMASHPAMEPGLDYAKCSAYMRPLWDALKRLPGKIVRLDNPCYVPTRAVSSATTSLYPSLWQDDSGHALLLATNMGAAVTGSVELKLSELDLPTGAKIRPLDIAGTFTGGTVNGSSVQLKDMPAESFAAFLIGK